MKWNQYPPNFYELIISAAIEKIVKPCNEKVNSDDANNKNSPAKVNLIVRYRCLPTENFIKQMRRSKALIQLFATLQKQKNFLPSLKPTVEQELRNSVVYEITCPGCHACYVRETSRHMIACFKEHSNQKNKPVRKYFDICIGAKLQTSDVQILASSNQGMEHLLTIEALYISEIKPELNKKDGYRMRELTIKF